MILREKLCENDSLNNNSPLPEQMILKNVIRLVYIPEGNNPLFIISPISENSFIGKRTEEWKKPTQPWRVDPLSFSQCLTCRV